MKRLFLVSLVVAIFSAGAFAKNRTRARIMTSTESSIEDQGYTPESESDGFSLGAELGAFGRRNSTDGTILGLDMMPGGRVFGEFYWFEGMVVRTSLGYYGKSTSQAQVSVTQRTFEAGVTAYLEAALSRRSRFLFGLANRGDMTIGSIGVYNRSQSTPTVYEYRVGPAVSLELGLGKGMQFVANLETTFSLIHEVRPYAATTVGITKRLW
jgi:hypothetical protein